MATRRHRPATGRAPGPARTADRHATRCRTGSPGLHIQPHERLDTTFRLAPVAVMPIIRDPGEVYPAHLLGARRRHHDDPGAHGPRVARAGGVDRARAHRAVLARWCGGAHANGSLMVVQGNRIHTVGADCTVERTTELPRPRPYNSFVCFDDGSVVTKDFGIDTNERCEILVLDPATHELRATPVLLPEPSIGRIAADGNTLYVTGSTTSYRLHWDREAGELLLDHEWQHRYLRDGGCLRLGSLPGWREHVGDGRRSRVALLHGQRSADCGSTPAPSRLIRVSLDNPADQRGGRHLGAAPRLPVQRDGVLRDPRHGGGVRCRQWGGGGVATRPRRGRPRWRAELGHAAHLLVWDDTGELVLGDHDTDRGDEVVVVDIVTGREPAHALTGSPMQTALFPCPGWDHDLYHTDDGRHVGAAARRTGRQPGGTPRPWVTSGP